MQKEKMTLRKWYGRSVPIPSPASAMFGNFLGGCIGIVRSIFHEEAGKKVRVRFVNGGTASASITDGYININADYANGYIIDKKNQLDGDTTISCVLGIIVHEAAHFAYSPATLEPAAEYIKKHAKARYIEDLAMALANIVEDIFIEAEVDRVVPALTWMLQCTNEIFFAKEDQDEREKAALAIVGPPKDFDEVAAAGNLLILAKTRDAVVSTPYMRKLFEKILEAKELSNKEDRFALALSIYDELMQNVKGQQQSTKDMNQLGELRSDSMGLTADHSQAPGPVQENQTSKNAQSAMRIVEETENCGMKLMDDPNATFNPVNLFIENPIKNGKSISMDARYLRLGEVARQNAVVNRPYGMDRVRGHSIRKLHRIATDQKIFADPLSVKTRAPMDVILLMDSSGSMKNSDCPTGETRLMAAARAVLGAAYGLLEARCGVAVYGHTADAMINYDVVIHCFKQFNESANGLEFRLGRVAHVQEGVQTASNRDGYALRYVANKFQGSNKKRLIIVISDGQPAGQGYSGVIGRGHSKKMADEVKQMGIDILSISIVPEAKESNDFIYGASNNVFNTDPNVIAEIVKSLVS